MKSSVAFFAGALALMFCLAAVAEEHPAAAAVATNEPTITAAWGWVIAQEKNVAGDELSPDERAAFLKGFAANARGQSAPCDLGKIYADIERLAQVRREPVVRATERKNEAAAALFFSQLEKNGNTTPLAAGVRYKILKPGTGPAPHYTQTVTIHYTGRLLDGTEFIQVGPSDQILVTNREVCRDWTDALQKLRVGGTMKLYVPPPLSEADAEQFGVPPGSAMVFDIELLGVTNTPAQDLSDILTPPAPAPPPPPPSDFTDLQIIETWGWTVAAETHVARFGLDRADFVALTNGLAAGIAGRPAPFDWQKTGPEIDAFVANHEAQARQRIRQKRLDAMNAFFAKLKQDTNVVELPDGLRYQILRPGDGPFPRPGQTVRVNYTGRLLDGTVFDRTDIGPLDIDLNKVIRGWAEGVEKINAGGRIRLYIPPTLGYGDEATSGIPADSLLIFDIDLLEIKSASGPEKP